MSPRTGRRAGSPDTREDILAAARRAFAEQGYDRATMRGIAAEAGVDPALIHHYFDDKRGLFSAAMALPANPTVLVGQVLDAGPPEEAGERIVRMFLTLWEGPGSGGILALLRSAMTEPHAERMLREFITDALLQGMARRLPGDDARLRATLVASQMIGLGIMRLVLRFEPLASADVATLVGWVAPTVQRYLTGDGPPALD